MLVWVGKKYLDPTQSPPSGRNGPIWPKMEFKKRPNLTMLDFFALFVVQCPFQWPCLTKTISTEPESPLRPNFITALWPWGPNFGQKFGPIRPKNEYAWTICVKWCTIAILMTLSDKNNYWCPKITPQAKFHHCTMAKGAKFWSKIRPNLTQKRVCMDCMY